MLAYIVDKHQTNVINNDLLRKSFSDSAKIASVRVIFKKEEKSEIGNYRPVSILNCFVKIYERFLHDQIASFSNEFLSGFISAYRKGCSTNHVFIRFIENWITTLNKIFLLEQFWWTYPKRLTEFHVTYSLLNPMLTDWVSTR